MKIEDYPRKHSSDHEGYEFYKRELVPLGAASGCTVSVYEVLPGKSAVPYHYHIKNEEAFYIMSGQGILKTPAGEQSVSAGDFFFFPAGEIGAHKLTNTSETELLIYMDFDTSHEINDLEVAVYPDSGKIGVFGMGLANVFRQSDVVPYYEGE